MSSLRLALKQSLADAPSGADGGADPRRVDSSSSSSSDENEASLEDLGGNDGASSTTSDEEGEETEHGKSHPYTQQHKAANKIQKTFRRQHTGNSSGGGGGASSKTKIRTKKKPERKAKLAPSEHESEDDESQASARTVPPPAEEVREHIRNVLGVEGCRANMRPGLRVKVFFDGTNWYGGCVVGVGRGGSKIRIEYDDGTCEVSNFPDGKTGTDIVVDDTANGVHAAAVRDEANMFVPASHRSIDSKPLVASASSVERIARTKSPPPLAAQRLTVKPSGVVASQIPQEVSVRRPSVPLPPLVRGYSSTLQAAPSTLETANTSAFVKEKEHENQEQNELPSQQINAAPVESHQLPRKHVLQTSINFGSSSDEEEEGELHESPDKFSAVVHQFKHNQIPPPPPLTQQPITATECSGVELISSRQSPALEEKKKQGSETVPVLAVRALSPREEVDTAVEPPTPDSVAKRKRGRPPKHRPAELEDLQQPVEQQELSEAAEHSVKPTESSDAAIQEHQQQAGVKAVLATSAKADQTATSASLLTPAITTSTAKPKMPILKIRMPKATGDAVGSGKLQKKQKSPRTPRSADGVAPYTDLSSDRPSSSLSNTSSKHSESSLSKKKEKESPRTKKLSIRIPAHKVKQMQQELGMGTPGKNKTNATSPVKEFNESPGFPAMTALGEGSRNLSISSVEKQGGTGVQDQPVPPPQAPRLVPPPKSPKQLKKLKNKHVLAAAAVENEGQKGLSKEEQTVTLNEIVSKTESVPAAPFPSTANADEGDSFTASYPQADTGAVFENKTPKKEEVLSAVALSEESTLQSLGLTQAELLQLEGPIRSERRAAQQANERIAAKQEVLLPEEIVAAVKKKKKKRRDDGDAADGAEEDSQWVQCDACGKWRIIPSSVVETLGQKWFCSDNIYDPKHASCEAPEQTAKQVAKEKKRERKRQRMMIAAAAAAESAVPEQPDVAAPVQKDKSLDRARSPRPGSKEPREDAEKPVKIKRSSPVDDGSSGEVANENRPKKEKKSLGKKGRSSENIERLVSSSGDAIVKPRGRGRPRRNQIKEASVASGNSDGAPKPDDGDNLEWVQCESCEKWRRLPPQIAADDLPEVWTCDMNTWNPASASCDAPEDKADGLQDIGFCGGTSSGAGKLTYRNLIYGNNGRKANRPVSERMRAAESLFAVQYDEDEAPVKVLYSDSSAFVSRGGRPFLSGNENEGLSVLELMSRSQLWRDLRAGPPLNTPSNQNVLTDPVQLSSFTYHTLPRDIKEPMKEFLLHILDSGTFAGDEVVRRANAVVPDSLPEPMRKAQPFSTENVVITTLCELVKEGSVDCVQKIGANWTMKDWSPHYRRSLRLAAVRGPTSGCESRTRKELLSHKRASRCMKIAKPWKRVKT